ncbi:MAG: FAD-dependent oxidoreductase, partial [Spirochaetia bacterium]|nr:FAD-dependent oxidoreductase [Spirochaetia bacterium]
MLRRLLTYASLVFCLLNGWTLLAIAAPTIVNDITQINPIPVDEVVVPKTVDEVRELVRTHRGPISIGGGHFSMGGQTASEQTLHLDMRGLNRIVSFSPDTKTITVEAGITWRAIQETIDRKNLSLKIMQSYSNFTVGGSLSVNVHGRYVGQGPLIGSVKAIKVVTLELADNLKVARSIQAMPSMDYKNFFLKTIKPSSTAIFHNADIYPPAYDEVLSITWSTTDKPVTIEDRLMPIQTSYWFDQLSYFWLSEIFLGKQFREYVIDPLRLHGEAVVWRNYEASYDVHQLEP